MPLPLEGLRILAVSQFGAGPFGTMLLGDLGAEVIKIEDPAARGDVSRHVPPYRIENDSLYFQSINRNKRSLTLNLADARGQAIFHRLVKVSHAVFNNLRGDVPARLGLTYETLGQHNPAIVCCSLSAFGRTGPQASHPGYDYLVQAAAGYMSITGEPDGPPAKCGISVIDFATGLTAMVGMLAAIQASQRSGVGCNVDANLMDTALAMLNYHAIWYLNRGIEPKRAPNSAHQVLVPCQNFRTRDGYVAIFVAKDKFWRELCAGMDRPDLAGDPRYATIEQRFNNKQTLLPVLEEIFLTRTNAEWMERLAGKVPYAPVRSVAQSLDATALTTPDMIVEVPHPVFGAMREVGCPVRISGMTPPLRPCSPLGGDTEEILKSYLGCAPNEIADLRKQGVV
jgi:crotonobetainyl-CoA:carnitine CoA-transferase CaiB-like acyl-CoA transferase